MGSIAKLLGAASLLAIVSTGAMSQELTQNALTDRVQEAIARDPHTRDTGVTATSAAGFVTLQGTVADPQMRERCARLVRQVPGVFAVANNISVAPRSVYGRSRRAG